jgi:hypothetical protein
MQMHMPATWMLANVTEFFGTTIEKIGPPQDLQDAYFSYLYKENNMNFSN